jgi:hypothetical protein
VVIRPPVCARGAQYLNRITASQRCNVKTLRMTVPARRCNEAVRSRAQIDGVQYGRYGTYLTAGSR